jgi:hypothetical protein
MQLTKPKLITEISKLKSIVTKENKSKEPQKFTHSKEYLNVPSKLQLKPTSKRPPHNPKKHEAQPPDNPQLHQVQSHGKQKAIAKHEPTEFTSVLMRGCIMQAKKEMLIEKTKEDQLENERASSPFRPTIVAKRVTKVESTNFSTRMSIADANKI